MHDNKYHELRAQKNSVLVDFDDYVIEKFQVKLSENICNLTAVILLAKTVFLIFE